MDWQALGSAIALAFVFEGLLPFANPAHWRQMLQELADMDDSSARTFGLINMLIGLGLLYWIRG